MASIERPLIPVARPLLGDEEAEAVTRVIRSAWVTQGPEVAAFEREFAAAVGAPHACAVSNCTVALRLALLAVGVRPGDEVITASHSFIATANAIRHVGALPVFVDIEPATFNLDPDRVAQAIGPRTRAILVVHQMGLPADLARLVPLAHQHGLPLIEDAACALGSRIDWQGQWQPIGAPHGDIACFSFHPRKVLTTGDGGMLTTRSAEFDARFRSLRQHAMSVSDAARHGASQVIFESYTELGYNDRMTDIQAAIGRVQLRRLPTMIARRRALAARYRERLVAIPDLMPPPEPAWAESNWQSYCVRLPEGVDQKRVMSAMLERGVSTRRGIMNSHREPAYAPGAEPWSCGAGPGPCGCAPRSCQRLRQSELAQDRSILLPLYHDLTEAELDTVVAALRAACQADH